MQAHEGSKRRRSRLRVITRRGLIRIAVLLGSVSLLLTWGVQTMFRMPGRSFRGPLPPLTEEERSLANRLRAHVQKLAGDIGERSCFQPHQLEAAAAYIEAELRGLGLVHGFERGDLFEAVDQNLDGPTACRNVCAEMPGADPTAGIVLLGAHYDSVCGTVGANDNASGAAALLEIARLLRGRSFGRTVRFVAFVNEEPPFFQTPNMGSRVHARACRARGDKIEAMIALETMGYFSDEPGSQQYPGLLGLLYPNAGNFIGFVSDRSSAKLLKECVRLFRETTQFPAEGAATFAWIPGVGWSDHWAFWQEGYPGIMVTDTAPYRYPHYHLTSDQPEQLDYERLARVVAGVSRVVARLADCR